MSKGIRLQLFIRIALLTLNAEGRLKMDLFESMKQTQSHNGFHPLNGVKSPGKDLQAKVPTVFLVDDLSEDVVLESKTQTLTLVIYPGKSKKDQEPVPYDSKQGESEMVPNSDEGPNSLTEIVTHESVSVGKEVAKHLEKDLFGNEREVGEDEKPGLLAVSRTGHSEPVSADETNDDIREDLYGHQSEWSEKQGSLLTIAKREIITIGKEETHGKYPGDLPIEQAEEKSETARDLHDFLGEEAEERGLFGFTHSKGEAFHLRRLQPNHGTWFCLRWGYSGGKIT